MNLPSFALDVASALASDPDRGKRILDVMKRYDCALTAEWIEQMRAYSERVWHGLERPPERPG